MSTYKYKYIAGQSANADATFTRYVGNDESKGLISKVLGNAAAPIEEANADVMGVWNMLYKVTQEYHCCCFSSLS